MFVVCLVGDGEGEREKGRGGGEEVLQKGGGGGRRRPQEDPEFPRLTTQRQRQESAAVASPEGEKQPAIDQQIS